VKEKRELERTTNPPPGVKTFERGAEGETGKIPKFPKCKRGTTRKR